MVVSLELVNRDQRKLEEVRNHGMRLATRFLGETHYLTKKLGLIKPGKQIKIRNTPNIAQSETSYGSRMSETDRSLAEFSEISEYFDH
jgi:hypothetical protein